MSYNIAYTSQFGDPDGILWRVDIYRNGFTGNPTEIGLDAEQPLIIEWQETKLQDAVCPSQCTLKVINDSDRLMVPLMTDDYVYCKIYRDNQLYWTGVLDQGVYEEPYSYNDGYITEITFSDFGALNRFDFNPFSSPGKAGYVASLYDIVTFALNLILIDAKDLSQHVSMILPGWGGNTAHLHHLYVNSRRLEGMTYRDVLEEILRPLSYRIVQRNGRVYVYDTEWMYDNAAVTPVEWMGDDARLSGGETYGKIELTFDRKSKPVIADGTLDPEDKGFEESTNYYVVYQEQDPDFWGAAFFVDGINPAFNGKKTVNIIRKCKPVRLRGKYGTANEACLARRIMCFDQTDQEERNLLETNTPDSISNTEKLFSLESTFLPSITDPDKYQLRINLDVVLSPKRNFFDDDDHGSLSDSVWKHWKNEVPRFAVPVILELLDAAGDPVKHYKNTIIPWPGAITILNPGQGSWEDGSGDFGEMSLMYYIDGLESNPLINGWAGNRQTISLKKEKLFNGYQTREDGEYIPIPPVNGRVRLTVGNSIIILDQTYGLNNQQIFWQLYRNPKITIVRAKAADDDVDKEEVSEERSFSYYKDTYSESHAIGTVQDGVSPACLGLLLNSAGEAYDGFLKNGVKDSLLRHRLNSLQDQIATVHSSLSGTARLTAGMCVHTDASTAGTFLATALRQDPRHGTEEISMTRISPGGDRYSYSWSEPVCATEEERYRHQWSGPVCLKVPEHYSFAWSGPVCAKVSGINIWYDI